MGKKYIIEMKENERLYKAKLDAFNGPVIQEIAGAPYTEPDFAQVKDEAYNDGYKAGREAEKVRQPDIEQVRCQAYEEGKKQAKVQAELDVCHDIEKVAKGNYKVGLADAWEAARKLSLMSPEEAEQVFPGAGKYNRFNLGYSGVEAIEKIRQYEQEQEELGIQKYFKNGEEVINADGTKAVILHVSEDNYCQVYTENGCIENWHIHTYKFYKTGRHFPEIASVLEKMRGEQDG